MNKTLVTCPVCKCDQHVYRKAIANHDFGGVRCTGSKTPLINGRPAKTFTQKVFDKKREGSTR